MNEFLKFISQPRVSILGGMGFAVAYELLQHEYWEVGTAVLFTVTVLSFYLRTR
jgi:hypothetical protein